MDDVSWMEAQDGSAGWKWPVGPKIFYKLDQKSPGSDKLLFLFARWGTLFCESTSPKLAWKYCKRMLLKLNVIITATLLSIVNCPQYLYQIPLSIYHPSGTQLAFHFYHFVTDYHLLSYCSFHSCCQNLEWGHENRSKNLEIIKSLFTFHTAKLTFHVQSHITITSYMAAPRNLWHGQVTTRLTFQLSFTLNYGKLHP